MVDSSAIESVTSIREADRLGASVVVLALAFLAVGYAGGSVLAGEAVESQRWLVPVLAGCLASWIALSARETGP